MPSYNYARFLPHAIESVLEQSYARFELLIVDNGSSDGSYEIAKTYGERDERVRVLTHARRENRGVNASLNLGVAEARGSYFGLLPADDIYMPESVERRVSLLEDDPSAGFVYGTALVIDELGVPTGAVGGRSPDAMLGFDATTDLLQALLFHDFVPGAAMLARRDLLVAIGGFDEAVYFNDWYATIRLLARTRCMFVTGDPVVGYRHHERHRSEDNLAADRPRKMELFRALRRHAADSGDRLHEPRIRALIALQRSVHASRLGQADEAKEAVLDAFEVDPSLREDGAYISWWLDPRHGEWALSISSDVRRSFFTTLRKPSAPVETVLASGGDYTRFVVSTLEAATGKLDAEAGMAVAWTAVAEQLEALGGGPRPRLLLSTVLRAAVRPSLLRRRPFFKVMLCAGGLWRAVATARRHMQAFRS